MPFASHSLSPDNLDILFEDNHLLVVNKPALVATMGAASGAVSLINVAKDYLKQAYDKPGNVYLGVVSRLDAHVTGVVVFARTSKSAARLSRQFQQRRVDKTYWAIVAGRPPARQGEWCDFLRKNEGKHLMETCEAEDAGAAEAITRFRLRQTGAKFHWIELQPLTGRKHQLRVQLASRRHPVVGDRKYGSTERFEPGIALHARALRLEHPVRREPIEWVAPLPKSWRAFGDLGIRSS
jgi:23S rRNA pseudouridine1911/1915/1917 synthase